MTAKSRSSSLTASDKLTSANEDYLEAIYQLGSLGTMPVRSVDLATKLDVSKASVNKALSTLKRAGLVEQPHYGDITLTDDGREYASSILDRHHVLYHFLIDVLRVEPAVAAEEACIMEHAISDDTLRRWTDFLKGHFRDIMTVDA
ncbi:MAG: metal-dependent transcriptional regulator [Coriobacteriales bacterium]|nr:metal-dependent transcriptional regulator [Coriobacteriales bacterium]